MKAARAILLALLLGWVFPFLAPALANIAVPPLVGRVVDQTGTLSSGEEVSVSGTLAGPKNHQKIVAVGEYDVDLALADHMVVLRYEDRPGVIGEVGSIIGGSGVNIAGMEVGRKSQGGLAVMGLTVDGPLSPEILEEIVKTVGAQHAHFVVLPE
jgi:D-3-phosphoglycerate dehydrogenase